MPTSSSSASVNGFQDSTHNQKVVHLLKRALFDVRAQLMVEADADLNKNEDLLKGLANGDLSSGFYEGGFKTWECAVDLASFVCGLELPVVGDGWHIIELGAGSAIPSMALLEQALRDSRDSASQSFKFTLCDYNEDVLRLVTAPNAFLASLAALDTTTARVHSHDFTSDGDMELDDVDEGLVRATLEALAERKVSVNFVSGSWGQELVRHVEKIDNDRMNRLVLASETIYSPVVIGLFTSTLTSLLRNSYGKSKAYVAAKRIYFGVGGGIDQFRREAEGNGMTIREVGELQDQGPSRVILEISL